MSEKVEAPERIFWNGGIITDADYYPTYPMTDVPRVGQTSTEYTRSDIVPKWVHVSVRLPEPTNPADFSSDLVPVVVQRKGNTSERRYAMGSIQYDTDGAIWSFSIPFLNVRLHDLYEVSHWLDGLKLPQ